MTASFLRERKCGQIDLGVSYKIKNSWYLRLYEVKSSLPPKRKQILRLKRAQDLLGKLLNMPVEFYLVIGSEDKSRPF